MEDGIQLVPKGGSKIAAAATMTREDEKIAAVLDDFWRKSSPIALLSVRLHLV